jgi:TetR/AcrR family transcriptional regulator, transcriptional repressor for nem operon
MKRGRPKNFDETEVLMSAMRLFWRKGYEATSLDDLVEAMGIPRQSLYRTFTDKRTLFLRALDLYDEKITSVIVDKLNKSGPAIDRIRDAFDLWINLITSKERIGCLMANTSAQFLNEDHEVAQKLLKNQKRVNTAFEKALARAQHEGTIDPSMSARAISRTIGAAVNGLLGMSRMGLPESFSKDVLHTLMTTFIRPHESNRAG